MEEGTFEPGNIKELVKCRNIKPSAYITIDICRECQFHRGIDKVMSDPHNKEFVVKDVICGSPHRIRIETLIEEINK